MSKLVRDLKAMSSGRTSYELEEVAEYDSYYTYHPTFDLTEYKVQLLIGSSGNIPRGRDVSKLVEQVQRQVTEHVFGEFRQYFVDIQGLMYKRNFDKASEKLHDMERQMFTDR